MQALRGGLADKKKAKDFSPKALSQGRKVESEHTNNPRIATEIAEDHLTEDPMYYDKLKLIEKKAFVDELCKIARISLADLAKVKKVVPSIPIPAGVAGIRGKPFTGAKIP
jgi:hypothetical protein